MPEDWEVFWLFSQLVEVDSRKGVWRKGLLETVDYHILYPKVLVNHFTEFFLASSKLKERLTVPLPKLTLGF